MGHGYVIQGTQYIKSFSMKIDHACFHQNIVFFFPLHATIISIEVPFLC